MPTQNTFKDHRWDVAPALFWKIALFVLGCFVFLKLLGLLLLLFLSVLLAVSLEPVVKKLESWRLPRMLGIALVASALGSTLLWVGLVLSPTIYAQLEAVVRDFPTLKEHFLQSLPRRSLMRNALDQLSFNNISMAGSWLVPAYNVVHSTVSSLFSLAVVFVMAVYMLVDGKRAFVWISAFFSAPVRLKLQATATQTAPVISAFVRAQILSCVLCGLFVFTLLTALHVPAAVALATIAAILDVLPLFGFLITLAPVLVLAFAVSPATAGIVTMAFAAYHIFEVYLLLPLIYNRSLKLPALVVLLSAIVAWSLGGLVAAIVILPVVASYPIIERIWLPRFLGRELVRKHQSSQRTDTMSGWQEKVLTFNAAKHADIADPDIQRSLGRTVLIVDDDIDTRDLLKDILETEGFRVLEASNGRDGIDLINRESSIGMILLDYHMPVMDGMAFMEKIRHLTPSEKIPVVFLSADASNVPPGTADHIIQKPVDFETLISLIHRHYRTKHASGDIRI